LLHTAWDTAMMREHGKAGICRQQGLVWGSGTCGSMLCAHAPLPPLAAQLPVAACTAGHKVLCAKRAGRCPKIKKQQKNKKDLKIKIIKKGCPHLWALVRHQRHHLLQLRLQVRRALAHSRQRALRKRHRLVDQPLPVVGRVWPDTGLGLGHALRAPWAHSTAACPAQTPPPHRPAPFCGE